MIIHLNPSLVNNTSRNNFVHSKMFITIHQLKSSKISNRYYMKTLSNTYMYMYNICIHVNESGSMINLLWCITH